MKVRCAMTLIVATIFVAAVLVIATTLLCKASLDTPKIGYTVSEPQMACETELL